MVHAKSNWLLKWSCFMSLKSVPRILTDAQKQEHIYICKVLQQATSENATCVGVIAGYESWFNDSTHWDKATIQRNIQHHQDQIRGDRWNFIFFYIKGSVNIEFVPAAQTVKSTFYHDVLWQLHENVWSITTNISDKRTACCIMITQCLTFPC